MPPRISLRSIRATPASLVMPAHSRSNGVASLAYVAGIQVFMACGQPKTWMAGTSPATTVAVLGGVFTLADLLYSRAVVPRPT